MVLSDENRSNQSFVLNEVRILSEALLQALERFKEAFDFFLKRVWGRYPRKLSTIR